jgi:hypothetical protein
MLKLVKRRHDREVRDVEGWDDREEVFVDRKPTRGPERAV